MMRSLTRVGAALLLSTSMSACGTSLDGTSQDSGIRLYGGPMPSTYEAQLSYRSSDSVSPPTGVKL